MSDDVPDAGPGETERRLVVDGTEWIARSAGTGAAGTGGRSLAAIEAVRFYRPGEAHPRWEALVARGRWQELFEEELAALLRAATPLSGA